MGENDPVKAASRLLEAFARSDLAVIEELCAHDVLLVGTDAGERWEGREAVLESFTDAFDLDARWSSPPVFGEGWLFGELTFTLRDATGVNARVTMVFRNGLLAHAHYSVPAV